MAPAIQVQNLSKRYRISHESAGAYGYKTLRDSITDLVAAPFRRIKNRGESSASAESQEDFYALKEVSFEVQPGEVVGIIGRNGAGKSTLLKILSRITKPSAGKATLNGRVGSLLEVGTGFHPELTGRENIFLNGSILGMKRAEIVKQFDAIVDFAGVEKFLDTPVKRYSSGMYVRLAFAVAAHLEPEILLVDEVLAVGDQAFQKKCAERMSEVAQQGRTVILVSHDIPMIGKLSTLAIWIKDGSIHKSGSTPSVIDGYYAFMTSDLSAEAEINLESHPHRRGKKEQFLERLRILDKNSSLTNIIQAGQKVVFELTFDRSALLYDHSFGVDICDISGAPLGQIGTRTHPGCKPGDIRGNTISCCVASLPLIPGQYLVNLWVHDVEDFVEMIVDAARITVVSSDHLGSGRLPKRKHGPMLLEGIWTDS